MLSFQTYIDGLTSGMLGSLQLVFLAKQKQNHIMISMGMKNGAKDGHHEKTKRESAQMESSKEIVR